MSCPDCLVSSGQSEHSCLPISYPLFPILTVVFWSSSPVPAVMTWQSCHSCPTPGRLIQVVLSPLFYPRCHVLVVLSSIPCPCCLDPRVPCCYPVLVVMSDCPVPTLLSLTLLSPCPIPAEIFFLTIPYCLAVLSWLPCHGCPAAAVFP
jgi:hypothetical protein